MVYENFMYSCADVMKASDTVSENWHGLGHLKIGANFFKHLEYNAFISSIIEITFENDGNLPFFLFLDEWIWTEWLASSFSNIFTPKSKKDEIDSRQ